MKRQMGHPDVEALANFRAGLVGGIHGRRITAHIARCERCAQLNDQLSAVTWALASVPVPALPDGIERRIGAAIAAEATARQVASTADPSAAASPAPASLAPAGPVADKRHVRRWSPRQALGAVGPRSRLSPVQMLVPVAACLLLAGLGYLLSMSGTAGMPPSARSAPALSTSGKGTIGPGPHRAIGSMAGGNSAPFLVTVSATQYQKSTLRAQVNSQLAIQALPSNISAPGVTGTPGNTSNGVSGNQEGTGHGARRSDNTLIPTGSLVGCVLHLTKGVQPALVQQATYQAERVYVIAVPDQAWVVPLSCTAAKPALITSVALAPVG